MIYFCCDQRRRYQVKEHSQLNGIYFLEVVDDSNQPASKRQRTLLIHFIDPENPPQLDETNVMIEGGERIEHIEVTGVSIENDGSMKVKVDKAGDFSIYTLRLVQNTHNLAPPKFIDPVFSSIDFSFKVNCPSDFDCLPQRNCAPVEADEPEMDYLARDYSSYRQMMLDRMSNIIPHWQERHVADQGMMLIELLAHLGDDFSYQLDAVATEAYLGMARSRISLRRHARLVDYFMHDGCNARAWMQVQCNGANIRLMRENIAGLKKAPVQLLPRMADIKRSVVQPASSDHKKMMESNPVVFELMEAAILYDAHNEIQLYTWGNRQCCLPKGATTAYLKDFEQNRLRLMPGDVLIFEQVKDPVTGQVEEADPRQRHAVRLTEVYPQTRYDENENAHVPGALIKDPLTGQAYVQITWHQQDALPFAVCVSAITDADHGNEYIDNVSVVRGNIVLADHGLTLVPDLIGTVSSAELFLPEPNNDPCNRQPPDPLFPRFRPKLANGPLTRAAPYNIESARTQSALTTMRWMINQAEPQIIRLSNIWGKHETNWEWQRDLINSSSLDFHYTTETEQDGTVNVRFGDGEYGTRPRSQTEFTAVYRTGNGTAGNLPADALNHIVTNQTGIKSVRNLLPATGGTEPETMEDVRQKAPAAYRLQQRAVTEQDYAEVTQRQSDVQKAVASFRWTGSWHTVFITADRQQGQQINSEFVSNTRKFVERFRMAGHDLQVDSPRFVPLRIEMFVCVKPNYFRADIKRALLDVFNSQDRTDGQRGYFHPDNWTFGQNVFLSPIYAAAQAVAGVDSVHIRRFERFYAPSPNPLHTGVIEVGRLEIAGLHGDRNYPERGVMQIELGGGK